MRLLRIKLLICISILSFIAVNGNIKAEACDANHLLVTAIKTLSEENDTLQIRIFKLEKRLIELEKLLKEHHAKNTKYR